MEFVSCEVFVPEHVWSAVGLSPYSVRWVPVCPLLDEGISEFSLEKLMGWGKSIQAVQKYLMEVF